ncbi:hypothetical protein BDZ91DRAFT_797448 [Kalaharituber pfeilii]|nr:hypothetical protein BDZ91DRAFT_797448 [Kalaharituber pfeilii]
MAPEEAAQVAKSEYAEGACQDRLSLAVTAPKKWTASSPTGFVKLPRIHCSFPATHLAAIAKPSLGSGLNVPNKSSKLGASPPPNPPSRKPIARKPPSGFFGAAAGEDTPQDDADKSSVFSRAGSKPSKSKPSSGTGNNSASPAHRPSKSPAPRRTVNAALATYNAISASQSVAHETSASEVDPIIYAYDSLYDSMKSATQVKKAQDTADAAEWRPKYMEGLLTVKNAKVHSDAETKRKFSRGLSGLYRNLLNRTEAQHDAIVAAAASSDLTTASTIDSDTTPSTPKIPLRPGIEVDDEGQVVDKRQLLSAGLNVTAPPKRSTASSTSDSRLYSGGGGGAGGGGGGHRSRAMESRARQTRMLEMQLEESRKRAMGEEKRREMVERQVKRGKTGEEVESAKGRYLRRKREREEAEKKEPDGGGVG